jgi:trimeric autotransporter adhesin
MKKRYRILAGVTLMLMGASALPASAQRVQPPTIAVGDVQITEGNSGLKTLTFPLTMSASSSQTVYALWTTQNGTATQNDFVASANVVVFAPGTTTATAAVPVRGDTTVEPNETFSVVIALALGANPGRKGTGTILNDDGVAVTLTSIAVTPPTATLTKGATTQLAATGTYSNQTTSALTNATWASSNTAVATVSGSGLVTATGVGAVNITAVSNGVTSNVVAVTVNPATLSSIAITPASPMTLAKGRTQQLVVTGTYSDGSRAPITSGISWGVLSGSAAITVSSTGLVTASQLGTGDVVATVGTLTATASFQVDPAAIVSIALAPTSSTIAKGLTTTITATATYTDGSQSALTNVTFASSNNAVATVSNAGLVTGVAVGSATVTASSGGVTSAPATITVNAAALVSVAITPTSPITLAKGRTQQLTATGTYSDGTKAAITTGISWTVSSGSTAVSVSSTGVVTAAQIGTADVVATVGAITATASVQVDPAALTSIAITPATTSLALGRSGTLTVTGTYSDLSTAPITSGITWASSSASATVTNGVVNASAVGSATITATVTGAAPATAAVTVTAAVLESIAIVAPATLPVGITATLTATGSFSDGSTAPLPNVNWTVDSPAASITAGVIKGVSIGSAGVTATVGAISSLKSVVAVTAAIPVSVTSVVGALTKVPGLVPVQFTATGLLSDGSTGNVTSAVTWSTTSGTVVAGLVTPTNADATAAPSVGGSNAIASTVTATLNATSASATLNVLPNLVSMIMYSKYQLPANIPWRATASSNADLDVFKSSVLGSLINDDYYDATSISTFAPSSPLQTGWVISNDPSTKGEAYSTTSGTLFLKASISGTSFVTQNYLVNPYTGISFAVPLDAYVQTSVSPTYTGYGVVLVGTRDLKTFLDTTPFNNASTFYGIAPSRTFTTSDPTIATVVNGSLVSTRPGLVDITSTAVLPFTKGRVASATATANVREVVSIEVKSQSPNVIGSQDAYFTAVATFDDGTKTDIASSVTWQTSDPGRIQYYGTVYPNSNWGGRFYGQGNAGPVTITASRVIGSGAVVSGSLAMNSVERLKSIELRFNSTTGLYEAWGTPNNGPAVDVTFIVYVSFETENSAVASISNYNTNFNGSYIGNKGALLVRQPGAATRFRVGWTTFNTGYTYSPWVDYIPTLVPST